MLTIFSFKNKKIGILTCCARTALYKAMHYNNIIHVIFEYPDLDATCQRN